MEPIRKIFDPSKPIDRRIEKVITYDTTDADLLRQEIQEYVVTESIEQNLDRLLNLLDEGMSADEIQEVGVWLSGFYGSGKSSFTKYVGFALGQRYEIDGTPFLNWLQNQCTSQALRARLATVAKKHPVTVIMVDLAASALTGASQEKISNTLYYTVMQWAGYSRDKKIAYLEFMLERDGKMKDFEKRIMELTKGKSWSDIKNQPLVVKAYASRLASEFYPDIWQDSKTFNEVQVEEAEKEDDRVREMLDLIHRRSGKQNVIFIVDEVGQYIAQRDDLILNLDGLAKNFKNLSRGHAWIIATAQQTLTEDDPRAALNTAKLFKLKDRFPVSIDLEARDIREICYRRLLGKSKEGEATLRNMFDQYGPQLRHNTQLKNTRYYKADLTKDVFSQFYPFLPHHFDILFDLLGKLAKTSGGIGLRSAIKVIQDVLIDQSKLRPGAKLLADEPVGALATTVIFYDTLQRDIARSFGHVVDGVEKVQRLFGSDSIHAKVAKSTAVLQLLEAFPVTVENISALLYPSVDATSQLEAIKNAVEELLKEPSIPLSEVDGSLRFMSAAVSDLEKEKNNIIPRVADTRSIFNKAIQNIFTPSPTARLHGTRSVGTGFKVYVGAMPFSLIGDKEEIQTHVEFLPESDYEKKRNERILDSQQPSNRNIIFLRGREEKDVDNMLGEIFRCRSISGKNLNKPADKEVEDYLRSQAQRANILSDELERLLKKSLSGGSFIFCGKPRSVSELSEDLLEAMKKYLEEVAKEVFDKYGEAAVQAESGLAERFLKTERLDRIASKDDPLNLVKKGGGGELIDSNHKAIVSIKDYLNQRGQVEGRKLLDDFYAASYGWSKDTTRYLIAAMLVGGVIKLRVSGEDITVRGDVAINSLKNTINFNKIGLALREGRVSPESLYRARERLLELTGESFLPLEEDISKAVMRHFPDFQQDYAPLAVELKNLELAGVERVENIRESLSEILKGDASDATNRLGGEECPLYDDLIWVREIKKAFDNGFAAIAKKARVLLNEIPPLPKVGIPGELIIETSEKRGHLLGHLSREDFFSYIPELQGDIQTIEIKVQEKASVFLIELNERLQTERGRIQTSSSWQQLGSEDQARFARELDDLQVGKADDLKAFKQLINDQYTITMQLQRIEREIETIIERGRKSRRVMERDLSHLPKIISTEEHVDSIITELESVKEDLKDYEEVILKWK